MILIVDDPADVHTHCVRQELTAMNVNSAVLDTSDFGKNAVLNISARDDAYFSCSDTGAKHRVKDITTVWLRRPGRFDLSGLVRNEYLGFVTREWRDMFWGWLDSIPARFVNPLGCQERATKILQLQVAHEVGLNVPETLVSNDATAIEAFVDRFDGQVIHKSLTQTKAMMLFTKKWDQTDQQHLGQVHLTPVMFQRLVRGTRDIRVTVMGDQMFAAIMQSPPGLIDSRLVTDLPYTACDLPDHTTAQILHLMTRLGLVYGTIDLKVADGGTLYFLEVNPQGQFAYIEIATSLPLVREFARFLVADPSDQTCVAARRT